VNTSVDLGAMEKTQISFFCGESNPDYCRRVAQIRKPTDINFGEGMDIMSALILYSEPENMHRVNYIVVTAKSAQNYIVRH
jgi:hypothetical protein